jgi:hypothetical protein
MPLYKSLPVFLAAVAAASLLALPAMAYPLTIGGAAKQAYAPKRVEITRTCKKTFGRHLYALVAVSLSNGKASLLALQFINTAGWFAMWKDNKVLPAVPKSQRASVRSDVNKLRSKCA